VGSIWIEYDPEAKTLWPDPDPFESRVVSRLNFDGVDGATSVTDLSKTLIPAPSWTFLGNAHIEEDVSPFGVGHNSLRLDGGIDSIYTDDLLNFGYPGSGTGVEGSIHTTSTCLRFWVKIDAYANGKQPLAFFGDIGQDTNRIQWDVRGEGLFGYMKTSGGESYNTGSSKPFIFPETWHHITILRMRYHMVVMVDGIQRFTDEVTWGGVLDGRVYLGAARSGGAQFGLTGNIADVQFIYNPDSLPIHPTRFDRPTGPLPIPRDLLMGESAGTSAETGDIDTGVELDGSSDGAATTTGDGSGLAP
jgi:hypothetical protein